MKTMREERRYAKKVLILLTPALLLMGTHGGAAESAREVIIDKIKGPVEVRMQGGPWQPAEKGMVLKEKDELISLENGSAEVLIDQEGETGKFEMQACSRVRVGELSREAASGDKKTLLELAIGRVMIHANKLKGNSSFRIKTPNAIGGVRGTKFEVNVKEKTSSIGTFSQEESSECPF